MMAKKDFIGDQTQFYTEEPGSEVVQMPLDPSKEVVAPTTPQKPSVNKYLIAAGMGLVLTVVSLGFLALSGGSGDSGISNIDQSTVEEQDFDKGPLLERVDELRLELEEADPSQDDLPLPPVDLKLSLE
jgi:hypothetical protein